MNFGISTMFQTHITLHNCKEIKCFKKSPCLDFSRFHVESLLKKIGKLILDTCAVPCCSPKSSVSAQFRTEDLSRVRRT